VDGAGEDLAAQSRMTRDLQRDLMRVRMVPFASLSERLFRVARQTAKETDKRVNLDIRGGAVEIDRSVLEQMAAPFEHLLRNAIVHGIERAQRACRRQARNRRTAGAGQPAGQRSRCAVQRRRRRPRPGAHPRQGAHASACSAPGRRGADAEAAELIFEPGFSTADTLTELAGRGVGMDVVRSEARALGGRVEIASEPARARASPSTCR
jgi:chemosensory pili system protein ChpA (sensor histidine kinase/response regulator)